MNHDQLARQIASMQWRVEGLRQYQEAPADQRAVVVAEVFQALDTTMEELRVTAEELSLKNEELKLARLTAEAERQRYRELFDHAPDGYLVTDLLGVIREANRAAAALLNIEKPYLVGKPLALFVPDAGRPAFRSELNRLGQAVGVDEYDLRLQPRHGTPIDAVVHVAAARDARGLPVALRWTIRDVSARVRDEEKIRVLNCELERYVTERSEQLEAELATNERWLIKAHAAAAESQAQGRLFHDLVHEVDAILWRADAATGRYTFVSRRAEAILGFPVGAWLDDPQFWTSRLHADDREWVIGNRKKNLRDGRDHESEYRLVAADCREVWFRESVRVLMDDRGLPRELYGLMVNISKRKKVERQLYTAKSQLATRLDEMTYLYDLGLRLAGGMALEPLLKEILNAVTSIQGADLGAIYLLDPGRDDLEVVATVGLSDEYIRLVGRPRRGVGPSGKAVETIANVVIEDVEADPSFAPSLPLARLGGYRAVFGLPLIVGDGIPIGAVETYFRDRHRPSERQIRLLGLYAQQAAEIIENVRRRGAAEESERRKGDFLAIMAHELRNPLAVILNATHLVHETHADDPDLAEVRGLITRQVAHMSRIVDDLLDATKLRNNAVALRMEPVTLATLAAHAVETARPLLEARRHEITVVMPGEAILLRADPTRLEQVLVNLLTNAAKYTEPGGRITLTAGREDDAAVLRVRDTGIGMAPEFLARAFDLFMQAGDASAHSQRGLGIGLWIVRQLVELHGGTIAATSAGPGQGSEFVVRLPLQAPETVDAPAPEHDPAVGVADGPRETASRRVLVVDDDRDSAHILARILRGWTHEVRVAHDGPSALDAAREFRPEVVLLDIGLPDMDGYEVARRLRIEDAPHAMLLIALTGYARGENDQSPGWDGFDDYLAKPVSPDVLRARLGQPVR